MVNRLCGEVGGTIANLPASPLELVVKIGILEVGDIFVVNKADRDGAHETVRELRHALSLAADRTEGFSVEFRTARKRSRMEPLTLWVRAFCRVLSFRSTPVDLIILISPARTSLGSLYGGMQETSIPPATLSASKTVGKCPILAR